MNLAPVASLIIKLFGVYQLFRACDDLLYVLAKQATDPRFDLYHYYFMMMGGRLLFAVAFLSLAAPLGKVLVENLVPPPKTSD